MDDLARPLPLGAGAHQIVSLAPSCTECLLALGAGTRLVGVDDHSDLPELLASVVRVGGFAVYATAASQATESALLGQLGAVPAAAWQAERARLWANQERQTKMRRFRLHRAAYLADLEARWAQVADPP